MGSVIGQDLWPALGQVLCSSSHPRLGPLPLSLAWTPPTPALTAQGRIQLRAGMSSNIWEACCKDS